MNLKFYLLSRMILAAILCLFATSTYLINHANRQALQTSEETASAIGNQLELQLLRINAGFDLKERFPDLELSRETLTHAGLCISYHAANNGLSRSFCNDTPIAVKAVPQWFIKIFKLAFHPGHDVKRTVSFRGQHYGSVIVSLNQDNAISDAWKTIQNLLSLTIISSLTLCTLVYVAVARALRPSQAIISGLEKMQEGDLSFRLPGFHLQEWQKTGNAVNRLVTHLEQSIEDRKHLSLQLMSVQEEERRYLARELHDELGQCLAAIHAIAAAISQSAENTCPELVTESQNISRIADHMMTSLRRLLLRLRPADLDSLGLGASLKSLIASWNAGNPGKTSYQLDIQEDVDPLPEPMPITIFRIVQECLTNISRHASATRATVKVGKATIGLTHAIECSIEDNGIANGLPFENRNGIGLIGIRERVAELGGSLGLSIGKPSGLIVRIWLPVKPGNILPS